MKKRMLFLCTNNSVRSQMAEGLMRHLRGIDYDVFSAGTNPTQVNQSAIEVMKEIGIDISGQKSKSIKEFIDKTFDVVVTLCDSAKESCPIFPGAKKIIHHSFPDPSKEYADFDERLEPFRETRDEIENWIKKNF
ncbi:MAG: arsenate reductase ArsC [Elusimicrobia bacterium]|nr:arsenate reductase ArsC [Elusimicrobiota bacterium]